MSSFGKKTRNPGYIPGDNWVICDRTGKAIRASDARKEWNGLLVAKEEFETRHPQDLLKVRPEKGAPSIVNPEGADQFNDFTPVVSEANCTLEGNSDVVGFAVAGCSTVGRNYG